MLNRVLQDVDAASHQLSGWIMVGGRAGSARAREKPAKFIVRQQAVIREGFGMDSDKVPHAACRSHSGACRVAEVLTRRAPPRPAC
jgi:hypothetical protein